MNISTIVLLIPLLPLLGFIINGLGFRKISKGLASIVGTATVLGSFLLSIYTFNYFLGNNSQPITVTAFNWLAVGEFHISFSFLIDQLSLLMLLVVTGVGTLIHLYSSGYMHHDEGFGKFFAFLNLFIFSMLLLVMGSNYVIMFFGWEGVGLCSYLLIGFWNKNKSYGNAARKAFVMNRIGDLGFLLGIFLIIAHFGSVEYSEIFGQAASVDTATLTMITAFLFVGAMGKSAQIPLYTWLPDAMAGPTPVSALIHAATMVTAGIYMVIRSNVLYTLAPATLEWVGIIGLATALLAASIGIFQNDIKKVLAYSTVSQLGYMFMGLGVMAYSASMFHVITHAFFKALLFLGAGSVIHAMSDEQDIRHMGGLSKSLRITWITFLLGTIAITAVLPLSGFFSKDEILMNVYMHSPLMWGLGVLGAAMTSFYMFRMFFLTFHGTFRGTEYQREHLHESPISMTLPLMILAVLSVIGGFINFPEIFGGQAWLANFMEPLFANAKQASPEAFHHAHLSHSQEFMLMGVSVGVAILSLIIAYVMYVAKNTVPAEEGTPIPAVQKFFYNKYYVDEIYDMLFVKPISALSYFFYQVFEFYVIDLLVEGIGRLVKQLSTLTRRFQTGTTGFYVFAMVLGIVVILLVNFWGFLFR